MLGGNLKIRIEVTTPCGQVRQTRDSVIVFSARELVDEYRDIEAAATCLISDQVHTALREYEREQENFKRRDA